MKKTYTLYVMAMLGMILALGLVLTGCKQPTDEDEEIKEMKAGTPLSLNTWATGELVAGGEHWYKFTATAATQYIHVTPGTLTDVYVQLYNSAGNELGSSNHLGSSYPYNYYVSLSVVSGSMYYIKVWSYSSSRSGTYKIAFTTSATTPDELAAIASAPTLIANTWANGALAPSGAQWFKFTATVEAQYVHFAIGTLTDVYVQLYNSAGNELGSSNHLGSSYPYNYYVSLMVVSDTVYYIKVWPYSSSGSGTYKIAFNTSTTAPS
ncbi:MAG: hypothetical protein LBS64_00980 [Spirochaetaceae bacterium]|jgi:hypothetical protein|nr:hypothetical protein [Spirochaetaceae bacterium]